MEKFGNTACFLINSSIMFPKMPLHPHMFISSTAIWFHLSPPIVFVFFSSSFSPSALLPHSHSLLHFLQLSDTDTTFNNRGRRAEGEKIERKKKREDKCSWRR
jgi:hypothetical protein